MQAHTLRLAAARSIAWALWLGGWLVLGEMGQQLGARWAGGLLPLAGWLATIGLLLHFSAGWSLSRRTLAITLLGAAALAASGLLWTNTALATAGWAALVVGASRAVRAVRSVRLATPGPRPSPLFPALVGGLLAWALAGELPALREHAPALSISLFFAAITLALLLPRSAAPAGGCRAGLFDCALPVTALQRWREPAFWPLPAATLAMLPMMAALPAMADSCGALGWPVPLATGLHLAAMLLPGALGAGLLKQTSAALRRQLVGLLLVLGGAALWCWPGSAGLMGAALLHGAAWSLAWAGALVGPPEAASTSQPHPHQPRPQPLLRAALCMAAATVALGISLDHAGLAALQATHAVLAALGAIGLAAATWHTERSTQVA